ncbi:MAG: hypothetical protein GH143_05270 [Calditrichaeota bacterium]|nr:hypothetical protein [Calditrichota bacterium]
MVEYDDFLEDNYNDRPPDPAQERARAKLGQFFEEKRERVSFTDRLRCNMKKNSSIG